MTDIIAPFLVRYSGNSADNQILDAMEYGESIIGASKLYGSVAHYAMFGDILHSRTKRKLVCLAKVPEPGSWQQPLFFISAVASDYGIHSFFYGEALSWVFGQVMGGVKRLWTQPKESETTIKELCELMQKHAEDDAQIKKVLAEGIIRANDNLASLHEKLIELLPTLAGRTRGYGRQLVSPVGSSCEEIAQFADTQFESRITESDAEVIRGDEDMEVDEMQDYKVIRIREINLNTGHCVLELAGVDLSVSGKITDPTLETPGNLYTRSLNEQTGFIATAKAVKKSGQIHKLHISDAKDQDEH